jgi:cell division protein FtsL
MTPDIVLILICIVVALTFIISAQMYLYDVRFEIVETRKRHYRLQVWYNKQDSTNTKKRVCKKIIEI